MVNGDGLNMHHGKNLGILVGYQLGGLMKNKFKFSIFYKDGSEDIFKCVNFKLYRDLLMLYGKKSNTIIVLSDIKIIEYTTINYPWKKWAVRHD